MQIAQGVIQRLAQGLSRAGGLDEGGHQHVVGELGRGPGVGEGEVETELSQPFLIVGVHHLQVSQGMGDPLVTVAGAGGLQCIQRHPGAAIADAVHVNAETGPIEGGDIVFQVGVPVVDDAVAARILAIGRDGHLLGGEIHGQVRVLVVFQHARIGQEGRGGKGIPFQYAIEEDLDRIGLDQGIVGKGASDLAGLGQVTGYVQFAAVVILVKAGGCRDAHVQQPKRLHLEQPLTDEVGGAGILYARDATRGHQGRDGGQDLVVLAGGLLIAGAEHPGVGYRYGAAGTLPDHPAGQIHVGNKGLEHPARCQGHTVETHGIAILILRAGQRLRVIGAGVSIGPEQHHRVVRCHCVQGGQQGSVVRSRGIAVVGGPLIDRQPLPLGGGVARQTGADLVGQLIQRDALTVQIAHIQRHSAEQVNVVVMQAGQHHATLQIHDLAILALIGLGPLA